MKYTPLAERLRPRKWEKFVGQREVVRFLEKAPPTSLIFWGPPGCGKTTMAYLLAQRWGMQLFYFSAVLSSVSEIKKVMEESAKRKKWGAEPYLLFLDEIHRFNKAQQAAFLPYVERGDVVLIGATTENPSFEVIAPLLSRVKVLKFEPLSPDNIREIVKRGIEELGAEVEEKALEAIIFFSSADARKALTTLEIAHRFAGGGKITEEHVLKAAGKQTYLYDKAGDYHYDLLSAFHKSLRNSDVDAALYWMARMLKAGEDPLVVARRMVRMAVEDIGLADPKALEIAIHAVQAYDFLGSPEGDLALAYAAIYLALAPKSDRVNQAWIKAQQVAEKTKDKPVPLHLRNPVTDLMEEMGYGKDYMYAHSFPEGTTPMECMPEGVKERDFYQPREVGFEQKMKERLEWFKKVKERMRGK